MYLRLFSCRLCAGSARHRTIVQKPSVRLMCSSPNLHNAAKKSQESIGASVRYNPVHIQMLPESLHQQIFKNVHPRVPSAKELEKVVRHLSSFELWNKKVKELPSVDLKLPELFGENIDEHFRKLAINQSRPYVDLVKWLLTCDMPEKPKRWLFSPGWTRYDPDTGVMESVPHPTECIVVFDVEVLMSEGAFPTMATAVTPKAW